MVSDEEVEEFLEHFGVKGMRWGIRNRQNNTANGNFRNKVSVDLSSKLAKPTQKSLGKRAATAAGKGAVGLALAAVGTVALYALISSGAAAVIVLVALGYRIVKDLLNRKLDQVAK